jgi:hypothetical protein
MAAAAGTKAPVADEFAPDPTALIAATVTVYEVPFVNPSTLHERGIVKSLQGTVIAEPDVGVAIA